MRALLQRLGIRVGLTTAYHPQTDGGTERMNQVVEAYLRIYCGNRPNEWINYVTDMEFAHNQHVAQGRNASPFFLMMGYNPRAIPTIIPPTNVSAVEERLDNLRQARQEAETAHKLTRQRMAE